MSLHGDGGGHKAIFILRTQNMVSKPDSGVSFHFRKSPSSFKPLGSRYLRRTRMEIDCQLAFTGGDSTQESYISRWANSTLADEGLGGQQNSRRDLPHLLDP